MIRGCPLCVPFIRNSSFEIPMIVPRNRLLFWVAVVVLPFALLAAVEPAAAVVAFVFIGGFAVVALADAFGAMRSLTGLSVELPPVTRLSKDREGKLELRIRNA